MLTSWRSSSRSAGERGRLRHARCRLAVVGALVVAAFLSVPATGALARGIYAGAVGSPAKNGMKVTLQLLHGGRSAKWQIEVFGRCNEPDIGFGWTLGTGIAGVRTLRIRAGRFSITKHGLMGGYDHPYRYEFSGHEVHGGFVGTFHWFDQVESVRCNSKLFQWRARPSSRPFP